ncbi:Gar1/Naf1 RNA binding region-domain-containing protein [Blakeslea trispora]|nr:Gar1/Naf1 RNA binding region-domain-containing protein [Blakeslea trispora]
MSHFSNDLEFVSEFAQQDLIAHGLPEAPAASVKPKQAVESVHEEIKIELMDQDQTESKQDRVMQTEKIELMDHDQKETKQEYALQDGKPETDKVDAIDAAIAGEKEGYESSELDISSDEDSSDESSSEKEEEGKTKQTVMMDGDEEETDEIIKTAHEIVDFVIERPDYEVTPSTSIVLAGHIYNVIDNVIVVHARQGSELSTLDQGSLLVYEDRQVMGEVFETFGPIVRPYYSVRYNTAQEIDLALAVVGAPVFYVPSYNKTHLVEVESLKRIKGSDASNMYDEEVDEEEMEFSDDEKELEHKRQKKALKRKSKNPRSRQIEDFDAALASYPAPKRQAQSYADLVDPAIPRRQPQTYTDLYDDPQDGQVQQSLLDLVNLGPPPSLDEE